jgi:hydroxyacylglutathione hydrolase
MRILPWLTLAGSRQFGLSSRYDAHLYALSCGEGILLIDAGSGYEQERVIAHLKNHHGDLSRGTILVTHKHPDHSAGASTLSKALGWPVITNRYTAPGLAQGDDEECGLRLARQLKGYPADMCLKPCPVADTFDDGDVLDLHGFQLKAIRVRGHSDDSYVFQLDRDGRRHLFTADVVFYGGVVGLINAPDSSLHAYQQDLPKLADLNVNALLPSHGLFTLDDGQKHIAVAQREISKGFVPRSIGQGDVIF